MVEAAEFADDGRQGCGDDGLIEGREEKPQHQSREDNQDLTMGHLGRLLVDVSHETYRTEVCSAWCARPDENRSNRSTNVSRSDRVQLEKTFESTRRLSLS